MSDFYQNGIITNFHNLMQRPVEAIEADLVDFSRRRPMGLILPSLFSELEGPALTHIVDELAKVPYLSEVVIGLDRADREQFLYAREFFSRLPQHHRILWNDGPRLKALDAELAEKGISPQEPGKGRNVWFCGGYVQASRRTEAIALHDCDIVTYDRGLLARLIYPVAHPQFNYEFCKGYYSRIAEGKLNGRVARLMVTPLDPGAQENLWPAALSGLSGQLSLSPVWGVFHAHRRTQRHSYPKRLGAWRSVCCQKFTATTPPSSCARSISPMCTTTSIRQSPLKMPLPGSIA